MDFLDFVKMCQEDSSTEQEEERERRKGLEMEQMPETENKTEPEQRTKTEDEEKERMEPVKLPEAEGREQREESRKMCPGIIYKVESGDTLYSISRKYDLRVRDIMSANPFVNVYHLQVGDELCIPVLPDRPSSGVRPYVVKKEDTVLSILQENNVTFEELARLNRSVAVLKLPVGTVLLLP